ncbi:LysM peptidoglycan-binding domain-containing protein [Aliivibrio sifiae]
MKIISVMMGVMVLMVTQAYASESTASSFGVEVNMAPTISSNHDTDWVSGGGLFLYQQNNWQVGVGVKSRYSHENETVSDLQLRYHVYEDERWGFDLGGGFEGTQPKLTYQFLYQVSPLFSLRAGVNTVFDERDENRLEAVFGVNYFFPTSSSREDNIVIEKCAAVPIVEDTILVPKMVPKKIVPKKPKVKVNKPKIVYYTVKPGDWMLDIARKFNMDLATLLSMNHLKNPDRIYPGQILRFRY